MCDQEDTTTLTPGKDVTKWVAQRLRADERVDYDRHSIDADYEYREFDTKAEACEWGQSDPFPIRVREPRAVARPLDEWSEEDGDAIWWTLPVCEPPWIGMPSDCDWPGYHTHWTPLASLPLPIEPQQSGISG